MLIVETIAKIRRAFFVQGKSIKAICRELRVSRKVVRKVIRSEATEFRYEREAQPLHECRPLAGRSLAAMRAGRQRWLADMHAKKAAGEIERFPGGRRGCGSSGRWRRAPNGMRSNRRRRRRD